MNTAENTDSIVVRTNKFFAQSWDELKKVTWPQKQQTMQATMVTIIIMLFVAACLFVEDLIFGRLMEALVG